jgi:drug/metabolite transporter (DMT)-like permease
MARLLLLSFIWGWSFLFIKVAGEGMTPLTVAGLRVALGAAALAVFLRAGGIPLPQGRRRWIDYSIAALVGNAVPFTLLAWSTQHIASGLTAVLNASTPLFAALFAAFYLGDRLRPVQIAGLAVGFLGVIVAAGFGTADVTDSSWLGALAAIGAGACYGGAFAYMRRHLVDIAPLAAATGQLIAATVMLAPFAVLSSAVSGFEPTPTRWLAMLLLGVVGTGGAYVINYRLLADLGPTKTALTTYIIPVIAVVLGIVFLDESFTVRLIVGGVLIAAGIAGVHERLPGRRRIPATPVAAILLLAGLVLAAAGCGGGSSAADGACGPVRREALDPNSTQHVLANAAEPTYLSDPPTSGPHQPGRLLSGAVDEPLRRPVQVAQLEEGRVLIQYREPLDPATIDDLVTLDGGVVVAPNPDLREPVVATAWGNKLECSEVDLADLRDFVDSFVGRTAADH